MDDAASRRHDGPSAWSKRLRLAGLALLGACVAGYLTLYQLGAVARVWDPFFGGGSREVLELTSPFPDAALGVLAYATELVLLAVGGADRWRRRPFVVLALGAVIAAGAVVSVALILVQALVAHAWCTLCLGSAAVSLLIFALGLDEPRAALRELTSRRHGRAGWRLGRPSTKGPHV